MAGKNLLFDMIVIYRLKIRRFFGRTVGKTKKAAKSLAQEVGSTLGSTKPSSKEGDAKDEMPEISEGDPGQVVKV